jgi:glycerate 2-kinase
MDERALLRRVFDAAITAASPTTRFRPTCRSRRAAARSSAPEKAAASMARAAETHWLANRPLTSLVVTRYGHGVGPLKRIEGFEASHLVPEPAGRETARVVIVVD